MRSIFNCCHSLEKHEIYSLDAHREKEKKNNLIFLIILLCISIAEKKRTFLLNFHLITQ